jgi:uncharacterized protein (DUF1330 family)
MMRLHGRFAVSSRLAPNILEVGLAVSIRADPDSFATPEPLRGVIGLSQSGFGKLLHREDTVPAYVLGDIRITDPAQFDTYRAPAGASVAQYGGRLLAAAGKAELLDGGPAPELSVVIEFPDAAAARRWYQSPEYQAALPIRLRSSQGRVFLIEGV